MKIASANLQMNSVHLASTEHEISESLRFWTGRRPDAPPAGERVTLSEAGVARQQQSADLDETARDAVEADPRLRLVRSLIELLTGRRIEVFDASELSAAKDAPPPPDSPQAPPAAGYGVEYDRHERYAEQETTRFSASGTVQTADGKSISFNLDLEMQRSFAMQSDVALRLGDAARKKDPLGINFGGSTAELSAGRFSFDLDSDGQTEQISRLGSNSAFLSLDRNADGRINDGSELFGTKTGDGFVELAALDDDSNGWIDENDSAWKQLSVWSPDADGQGALRSLAEAGVGAIALARVASPFDLKDADNRLLGQVRSSGIYLSEAGQAGSIQQIDLAV